MLYSSVGIKCHDRDVARRSVCVVVVSLVGLLPPQVRSSDDGEVEAARHRGLSVESLEGRQLLSNIFTVTSTGLDGVGTLRGAIEQVDGDQTDTVASPDRIEFAIPTTDPGYKNGSSQSPRCLSRLTIRGFSPN